MATEVWDKVEKTGLSGGPTTDQLKEVTDGQTWGI